jgi:hypothetical protein
MELKLRLLQEEAKFSGLNIDVNKTKEMKVNAMIEEKLSIYDKEDEQVDMFTYLEVLSLKMVAWMKM